MRKIEANPSSEDYSHMTALCGDCSNVSGFGDVRFATGGVIEIEIFHSAYTSADNESALDLFRRFTSNMASFVLLSMLENTIPWPPSILFLIVI